MTDENDPFAPFARLFDQFGAGTAPERAPPPGVPVLPVPESGAAGLSPEQSTKAAVRNLYRLLEGATGGADTPAEFWGRYLEAWGAGDYSPARFGSAAVATYRVWFLSLAQLLVEGYTVRLLHDELVAERYRSTAGTGKWLWGLPQADREQLLLRCLDVDGDLVADMRAARERRDELLYDLGSWAEADPGEALDDARRYLRVLDSLDDRATDGSFSFRPENESGDGNGNKDEDGR